MSMYYEFDFSILQHGNCSLSPVVFQIHEDRELMIYGEFVLKENLDF